MCTCPLVHEVGLFTHPSTKMHRFTKRIQKHWTGPQYKLQQWGVWNVFVSFSSCSFVWPSAVEVSLWTKLLICTLHGILLWPLPILQRSTSNPVIGTSLLNYTCFWSWMNECFVDKFHCLICRHVLFSAYLPRFPQFYAWEEPWHHLFSAAFYKSGPKITTYSTSRVAMAGLWNWSLL